MKFSLLHLLAGLLAVACAFGQTSARFDVASVKRSEDQSGRGAFIDFRNGRLTAQNRTLKSVISNAYGVEALLISGGPDWAGSERYSIEAKAEGNPTDATLREMTRSLLADRFKLKVHFETRSAAVYELRVGKSGPKLGDRIEQTAAPVNRVNRGFLEAQRQTLGGIASYFSTVLGRTVLDKTGIEGAYTFVLKWTPDEDQSCGAPGCEGRSPRANPELPNFFTAVKEQLGLEMVSAKDPVEYLVIDRAEKPTPN